MNVLSLFSGIGGLDLGLQRAGMTIAGQVEIDPWCRKVLAKHWPEVPRHDDVRTAVEWWGSTRRPAVHVVAGGPPCQPISVAGKGLGPEDERWLWPAYFDILRDLRPDYAIMENPAALLARGFGGILGELAEIGYDAEWDCLPASAFGAYHRRDRVLIVAYPHGSLVRLEPGRRSGQGGAGAPVPAGNGASRVVADSQGIGRGARRPRRPAGDDPHRPSVPPARLDFTGTRPQRAVQWAAEPGVGRVVYGLPPAVDRLRGLGNAVVPQVAEHIGRLIMEAAA